MLCFKKTLVIVVGLLYLRTIIISSKKNNSMRFLTMLGLILEAHKMQNGFIPEPETTPFLSKGKKWFYFYDDKIVPSEYAEIADFKCVATGEANAMKKYQNWKIKNK